MPAPNAKPKTGSLKRTDRIIQEATRVGFQWKNWAGPLRKVKEELGELEKEIRDRKPDKRRISDEIGDVLFSVCNLAALLGLNPETSLHATLDKFQRRFRFVEDELKKLGKLPRESNLKEMGALWRKAKRHQKND